MAVEGRRIAEWDEEGGFVGLAKGQCRWPVGLANAFEMRMQRFCAMPSQGVYCDHHHGIAHEKKRAG